MIEKRRKKAIQWVNAEMIYKLRNATIGVHCCMDEWSIRSNVEQSIGYNGIESFNYSLIINAIDNQIIFQMNIENDQTNKWDAKYMYYNEQLYSDNGKKYY